MWVKERDRRVLWRGIIDAINAIPAPADKLALVADKVEAVPKMLSTGEIVTFFTQLISQVLFILFVFLTSFEFLLSAIGKVKPVSDVIAKYSGRTVPPNLIA